MLPFGVTIPATVRQRSEIPEGLNELFCIFDAHIATYVPEVAECRIYYHDIFKKRLCIDLSNIGQFCVAAVRIVFELNCVVTAKICMSVYAT
jgi:hypothetical protein